MVQGNAKYKIEEGKIQFIYLEFHSQQINYTSFSNVFNTNYKLKCNYLPIDMTNNSSFVEY